MADVNHTSVWVLEGTRSGVAYQFRVAESFSFGEKEIMRISLQDGNVVGLGTSDGDLLFLDTFAPHYSISEGRVLSGGNISDSQIANLIFVPEMNWIYTGILNYLSADFAFLGKLFFFFSYLSPVLTQCAHCFIRIYSFFS